MPSLTRGRSTTIELKAGETLSLSAGGTIIGTDGAISHDFTQWPMTLGAFSVATDFIINAVTSDIDYTVTNSLQQTVRFEYYDTESDLPEAGSESVIYRTHEGAFIWNEVNGTYVSPEDALSVPLLAESGEPVVSGDPVIGQTLSTTNGDWLNRPTLFTYQWWTDAVEGDPGEEAAEIEGATGNTLVLDEGLDGYEIYCEVLASNAVGDAEAEAGSNVVGPVTDGE